MKTLLRAKPSPSLLMAAILAIGATSMTACSDSGTKAVDRVEEAEALARVKSLESSAAAIKASRARQIGVAHNARSEGAGKSFPCPPEAQKSPWPARY